MGDEFSRAVANETAARWLARTLMEEGGWSDDWVRDESDRRAKVLAEMFIWATAGEMFSDTRSVLREIEALAAETRRVFAELVVTDRRGSHGCAHAVGRPGYCIGTQVNGHVRDCTRRCHGGAAANAEEQA